jgi:hypothetical protein
MKVLSCEYSIWNKSRDIQTPISNDKKQRASFYTTINRQFSAQQSNRRWVWTNLFYNQETGKSYLRRWAWYKPIFMIWYIFIKVVGKRTKIYWLYIDIAIELHTNTIDKISLWTLSVSIVGIHFILKNTEVKLKWSWLKCFSSGRGTGVWSETEVEGGQPPPV